MQRLPGLVVEGPQLDPPDDAAEGGVERFELQRRVPHSTSVGIRAPLHKVRRPSRLAPCPGFGTLCAGKGGVTIDQAVRPEIAKSWKRCELIGVSPAVSLDPSYDDFDGQSRLVRAARDVLDRLAAELDDTKTCVILADAEARIVERRLGMSSLAQRARPRQRAAGGALRRGPGRHQRVGHGGGGAPPRCRVRHRALRRAAQELHVRRRAARAPDHRGAGGHPRPDVPGVGDERADAAAAPRGEPGGPRAARGRLVGVRAGAAGVVPARDPADPAPGGVPQRPHRDHQRRGSRPGAGGLRVALGALRRRWQPVGRARPPPPGALRGAGVRGPVRAGRGRIGDGGRHRGAEAAGRPAAIGGAPARRNRHAGRVRRSPAAATPGDGSSPRSTSTPPTTIPCSSPGLEGSASCAARSPSTPEVPGGPSR